MTTTRTPASGAADKVLAYLDDLSDDAAAHIFPSDLAKCMTSECVVEVVSVRAGNPNERTVPLFSREQVVAALASTTAQPVAEPAKSAAYAALPEYGINTASHAHFRVLGFTADQMHAFADATHALRASHGQAPAQPDPAYSEACNLATALFKKHFAHLPDYASGQVVWGLFDSTEGVILQIDNMVAGLVQPPTTSPQADSVQEDAADPLQGAANWLAEAHGQFSPVVLSGCLMIGYNRAKRLHDAALAARKQGENHD